MLSRIRACALMTTMAVGVATLPATPALAAAPASTDEAKRLYNEGKSFYDVGEYEKALDLWKQAYTKLDDSPDMQTVRHTLVYNILEAEIRVYEVTKDVTHLRRAKTLLETYLKKHNEIYEDTPEAQEERKSTETRLAEVEQMLAEAEANAPSSAPAMVGGESAEPAEDDGVPDLAAAKLARAQEIQSTPSLKRKDNMYKGFIIGGSVGIGAGLIMSTIIAPIVGIGNIIEEVDDPLTPEDESLNGGGVDGSGSAVFAGGLLLAGAGTGFLVAGIVLRKKLRRPKLVNTTFAPYATRHSWGVGARVKF